MSPAKGQASRNCALGWVSTSRHLRAPSPTKSTGPAASSPAKDSGPMTLASTGVRRSIPGGPYTAVYTSILRASIIGTMNAGEISLTPATSTSSVSMERSGMPAPKASPLAVETPTRRPVYEPGPLLTHTAWQSRTVSPRESRTSLTSGAVREACWRGSSQMREATTSPSWARATDSRAVEVSRRRMRAMGYELIISNCLRYGNTK